MGFIRARRVGRQVQNDLCNLLRCHSGRGVGGVADDGDVQLILREGVDVCAVTGIDTAMFKAGMTFVFMDKQTAAVAAARAVCKGRTVHHLVDGLLRTDARVVVVLKQKHQVGNVGIHRGGSPQREVERTGNKPSAAVVRVGEGKFGNHLPVAAADAGVGHPQRREDVLLGKVR